VKWISGRRPSPALIVALIALFVSLSGVSYGVATGFIDSREIKNNEVRSIDLRNNQIRSRDLRNNEVRGIDIRNSTVQGRDIALNTVTGDDVKEDTLQKVPSAMLADSATRATTADSAGEVGGIELRRIAFTGEAGGTFTEILNLGGLRLEARCAPVTGLLEVQANPTAANGEFASDFTGGVTDDDFDPGDDASAATNADDEVGQIAYAGSDNSVVTVDGFAVQDMNDVRGTTQDCGFFGTAQAG
jgi:hypothetical protein